MRLATVGRATRGCWACGAWFCLWAWWDLVCDCAAVGCARGLSRDGAARAVAAARAWVRPDVRHGVRASAVPGARLVRDGVRAAPVGARGRRCRLVDPRPAR